MTEKTRLDFASFVEDPKITPQQMNDFFHCWFVLADRVEESFEPAEKETLKWAFFWTQEKNTPCLTVCLELFCDDILVGKLTGIHVSRHSIEENNLPHYADMLVAALKKRRAKLLADQAS